MQLFDVIVCCKSKYMNFVADLSSKKSISIKKIIIIIVAAPVESVFSLRKSKESVSRLIKQNLDLSLVHLLK